MDTALLVRILSNIRGSTYNNPVSTNDISALTHRTLATTDNHTMCSICHENIIVGNNIIELECTHLFHEQCISNWFRRQNTCPNCRAHVGTTPLPDDESIEINPELISEIPLPRFFALNNDINIKLSYQLITNGTTVTLNTLWNPRFHSLIDIYCFIRRISEFNNLAEIIIIGSLNRLHIFRSSQSYSSLSRTLSTLGISSDCTFTIHGI